MTAKCVTPTELDKRYSIIPVNTKPLQQLGPPTERRRLPLTVRVSETVFSKPLTSAAVKRARRETPGGLQCTGLTR